jgi:flagellar basal body P-ring formation protein FlgA
MTHDSQPPLLARIIASCCLTAAFAAWFANPATSAELRLRAQCNPAGPVVTLGDVADIEFTDTRQAAALAAIELFPAPAYGEQRMLPVREIQDLLVLHGMNLTEHRFSGSSEVTVQTIAVRPRAAASKPVPAAEAQRIKRRACEVLVKYLAEHSPTPQTWAVECELTDEQARLLADPVRPIGVAGGATPWIGAQRFDLTVDSGRGLAHVALDADVRIVPPVVVARRPLARGAVIHEDDVELQRPATDKKIAGALTEIQDAVGRELLRPVAAGGPIASDTLRAPLSVHRGEVVTVYAQSGSIRIRTNARARDEGSLGELVAVESLLAGNDGRRSTYYARVSGIREVEVYARPARVEGVAEEETASAGIRSKK